MKIPRKLTFPAVLLLCAALLAVPPLAAHAQDAKLTAGVLPRPDLLGDALRTVRDDPLLYSLYLDRFGNYAYTTSDFAPPDGAGQEDFRKRIPPIKTQLDKLVLHGVLPEDFRETMLDALQNADPAITSSALWTGETGFVSFRIDSRVRYTDEEREELLRQMKLGDPNFDADAVADIYRPVLLASVTYHTQTGLVAGVALDTVNRPLAPELDAREVLDAYRSYLGLDDLQGWTVLEAPHEFLPAGAGFSQTSTSPLWMQLAGTQGGKLPDGYGLCYYHQDSMTCLVFSVGLTNQTPHRVQLSVFMEEPEWIRLYAERGGLTVTGTPLEPPE